MRKLRLGFIICWFAINAVAQSNFVYTNDSWFPNTVSAFRVNADGSLTLIEGSPFLTGGNGGGGDVNPGKITTATVKGKGFLYAANNGSTTIAAFRINADTGQLVAVPGSPFLAGTPNSNSTLTLAAGPKGHFLFSADESTTSVRVFAI